MGNRVISRRRFLCFYLVDDNDTDYDNNSYHLLNAHYWPDNWAKCFSHINSFNTHDGL